MKRNHTTISIPVKPYVCRFLEINYGEPVDFTGQPYFYNHIRRMVRKPDRRCERKLPDHMRSYSAAVNVLISEDDLQRYGYIISKTDVVRFGTMFEWHIKWMMRSIVGMRVEMGYDIKDAIEYFQDKYNFDENVWAFESIRKDFYRNGTPYRVDFRNEITTKIERKFMENLSRTRDNFSLPRFDGYESVIRIENEQSNNF